VANHTSNQALHAEHLHLRRLKLTDIDAIMAIESTAFGRFHWSANAFEQEMSNHLARYWVLTAKPTDPLNADTTRLLGYLGYWLVFDEVHITTVAVDAQYRGQGLGELLVAKAVEQSQGHSTRTMTLEVRRSNQAAQQLYAKYQFAVLGIRPQYYQDNQEDALIMTNEDILSEPFRQHFSQLKHALFNRFQGQPAGFS
jgi:[ribosomal protein S18]-alanine N-acetyltransferase